MQTPFVNRLDSFATWRSSLDRSVGQLGVFMAEHELLEPAERALIATLHERLAADRVLLAVVAEFSRGKSELINAMFFADAGRRLLPATPGRTTMCPVELYHDGREPPQLKLLPIRTRLQGLTLAELRLREEPWEHVPLDPADADGTAQALLAVTRTEWVDLDTARALGLWRDDAPEHNPPRAPDGRVQVPAWRHARINHPHPLLQRGLVVLDTPGLNAVGAEPELTLSLLPAAHATLFLLGADSGVTKSDLMLWRDHLGGRPVERFVVLNKIDALADPLATPAEVRAQIERQREQTAATLDLPLGRVFPLSARDALAGRVSGDEALLARSRLPELEAALADELLPQRAQMLAQAAVQALRTLRADAARRLVDRRRQNAEQMLELRGLRGRSAAKRRLMAQRAELEAADFERCTARLSALRAVQMRMLRDLLAPLSSDGLRLEVSAMHAAFGSLVLPLVARRAFTTLCGRLHTVLSQATQRADEMRQMLEASFEQLNAEFGFAFALAPVPALKQHVDELALIERNYTRYLSWTQSWRLGAPGFADQFRRMLLSKLRIVFESAAAELEQWSKAAGAQLELQLRERRRGFERRRDALARIESAGDELEARIDEVEAQDARLQALALRLDALADETIAVARGLLAPAPAGSRRNAA